MKLLCDEMLKGLARWLRAAGHDTELALNGEADRELIARARKHHRLLISRDRKLLEHRGAEAVVRLLEGNGIDACALELSKKTGLDWQYKPFTRCLICNAVLRDFQAGHDTQLPDDVKDGPLLHCPQCQRIYWQGGHVKRMRNKLQAWHDQVAEAD